MGRGWGGAIRFTCWRRSCWSGVSLFLMRIASPMCRCLISRSVSSTLSSWASACCPFTEPSFILPSFVMFARATQCDAHCDRRFSQTEFLVKDQVQRLLLARRQLRQCLQKSFLSLRSFNRHIRPLWRNDPVSLTLRFTDQAKLSQKMLPSLPRCGLVNNRKQPRFE